MDFEPWYSSRSVSRRSFDRINYLEDTGERNNDNFIPETMETHKISSRNWLNGGPVEQNYIDANSFDLYNWRFSRVS